MKKVLKIVAAWLAVVCLALVAVTVIARRQMRPEVQALVIPVLSSCCDDTPAGWDRTEELLQKTLNDKSDAGDEASAVLLDYYLGEHNHELLMINISQRGQRVMPYLLKYRDYPGLPLRPDFWGTRLDRSTRELVYDMAIDLVRQGKVLEEPGDRP